MNIYLTLDYELFMGVNSGTVMNCMVAPINRLVERTKDIGVKFTLFVDAAYLYRIHELRHNYIQLQEDYNAIVTNLQHLVNNGHSIQLHNHPQWFFSTYKKGKWNIDQSHYKLSDLPTDKLQCLFSKSKQLLEEIIGHKVTAFRAGGYSIQSLTNHAKFLTYNNIYIDSSVASGQQYLSAYQWYNYKNVCSTKVYRFDIDITKEDKNGHITEYPITSIYINSLRYILYRLYLKLFKEIGKPYGDGKAVPSKRKIHFLKTQIMNYSFDYVMAPMLYSSFQKLIKLGYEDVILIGHPKNQSIESIEELRKFILKTKDIATYKTIC